MGGAVGGMIKVVRGGRSVSVFQSLYLLPTSHLPCIFFLVLLASNDTCPESGLGSMSQLDAGVKRDGRWSQHASGLCLA